MARDLSDVVDLMLLPLLERDASAIVKQETGTLSVEVEIIAAKQKVDEMRASATTPSEQKQMETTQKLTRYYLGITIWRMASMAMKRTSFHFDTRDMQALERLAKLETERVARWRPPPPLFDVSSAPICAVMTRKHQGAHHDCRHLTQETEQNGVSDEQKSVARQIEHAKAYAKSKGWTVPDPYVFVDDGVSGAEFGKRRPGLIGLMNALKPEPPFQVLIMSEESRLGRDRIKTEYHLQDIIEAGVRVFYYLSDHEARMDDATSSFMQSVKLYAAQVEREKAQQRAYDAMVGKAKAGYVTGGCVFGYDNQVITGSDGKRSHVELRINATEAELSEDLRDSMSPDMASQPSPKC